MRATNVIYRWIYAGAIFASIVSAGCVQMPTERAAVSDMRPQISFVIADADASLRDARVQVNGFDVGRAGDYMDGKAALRVLPGTNLIKVVDGSRTVVDERIYVGDGVSRSILLK